MISARGQAASTLHYIQFLRNCRENYRISYGQIASGRLPSFKAIFDSRIIRRMMCESMLSTNAEIAPVTVAMVNQTALQALCVFFKQTGT